MKSLLLVSLFALTACSSSKIALTKVEYKSAGTATFVITSLKEKSKGFDIRINSISDTHHSIAIKKEDIECGRGLLQGQSKMTRTTEDFYTVIPSHIFKEFNVNCSNSALSEAQGNYFVKIKNIYDVKNDQPNKVIASDVMLDLN